MRAHKTLTLSAILLAMFLFAACKSTLTVEVERYQGELLLEKRAQQARLESLTIQTVDLLLQRMEEAAIASRRIVQPIEIQTSSPPLGIPVQAKLILGLADDYFATRNASEPSLEKWDVVKAALAELRKKLLANHPLVLQLADKALPYWDQNWLALAPQIEALATGEQARITKQDAQSLLANGDYLNELRSLVLAVWPAIRWVLATKSDPTYNSISVSALDEHFRNRALDRWKTHGLGGVKIENGTVVLDPSGGSLFAQLGKWLDEALRHADVIDNPEFHAKFAEQLNSLARRLESSNPQMLQVAQGARMMMGAVRDVPVGPNCKGRSKSAAVEGMKKGG